MASPRLAAPDNVPEAHPRAMNVVLFAWCPSSIVYLAALHEAGALPRLVVTGSRCGAARELAAACARLGVPIERCPDINAADFRARIGALSPDLLLVAGCAQILGPELL